MAAKSSPEAGFAPVLAALATMQSNASRSEKGQAHEFLEQFQKSVRLISFYPCLISTDQPLSRKHGLRRMLYYKAPILLLKPGCLRRPR
jgi:transportin-3